MQNIVLLISAITALLVHSLESKSQTLPNQIVETQLWPSNGAVLTLLEAIEPLDIQDLDKRDTTLRFESLMTALQDQMTKLKMSWLIDEEYHQRLLSKGKEQELHSSVGVIHSILTTLRRSNVAYSAKQRDRGDWGTLGMAGENFGGVRDYSNGYTLLNFVSGNSEFLMSGEDAGELTYHLMHQIFRKYENVENRTECSPHLLTEYVWGTIKNVKFLRGCVSTFQAIVDNDNRIEISYLGLMWAGLFRDGELVEEALPLVHTDGSFLQLCNFIGEPGPTSEDTLRDSKDLSWEAQANDTLVVVSQKVHEILGTEGIKNSFETIKNLGPQAEAFLDEDDFDLVAMGIVKAAKIAIEEQSIYDLFAVAVDMSQNQEWTSL